MTTIHDEGQDVVSKKQQKNSSKLSGWILFFLLIVVGFTAYALYSVVILRKDITQQSKQLLEKVDILNAKQGKETTQLGDRLHQLSLQQEKITLLDKQMQMVLQQQSYQASDWGLLRARYFLELAQINASWTDDLQTSSALLNQADVVLENIHDQRVYDVRKAIAEEKTQVDAAEKIDVVGVLNQLSAAQKTATHLLARQIPLLTDNKEAAITNEKTSSVWRMRLDDSIQALKKLVVVRRVDESHQPLMTPDLAALLRENIQLILQEAQFAVLQHNEVLYHFLLKQVMDKIKLFDLKEANTQALQRQLDALAQLTVVQKKPHLGQALLLLNQIIDPSPAKKLGGEKTS